MAMKFPPGFVSIIRNLPPIFKPVRVGRVISAVCVKLGFSEWVEVKRDGVVFHLSLLCRTSAGEIWRGGNHGSEINMFSIALEPATTFIDIGANVGLVVSVKDADAGRTVFVNEGLDGFGVFVNVMLPKIYTLG
jgi:hypothetical protein